MTAVTPDNASTFTFESGGTFLARLLLPYPTLFTYTEGRDIKFKGRHWHWVINAGIWFFIFAVIPVNMITQGYQPVATYEINFNTTAPHWFDILWWKPKAGSDCDPHIFTVGDTFVTNIGSFLWTVSAAKSVETELKSGNLLASKTSIMGQYSGTSLDWCDVQTLHVFVDLVQWKTEVSAVIACYGQDYILANTVAHSGIEDDAWFREKTINTQIPNAWVQAPVQLAALDLLVEMNNLAATANSTQYIRQLAFTALPTQCPQQYIKDAKGFLATAPEELVNTRPWCTPEDLTAPPALGIQWNTQLVQVIPMSLPPPVNAIANAVNNTLQAMVAAVRWDLGNLQPNNFLSNTREVLTQNETFFPPYSTPSQNNGLLFNYLTVNPWNTTSSFQGDLPDTPLFLVDFLCHLSVLKSASSLLVAILVGTLSICNSAWSLLLLLCAWAYKNHSRKKKEVEAAEAEAELQSFQLRARSPEDYQVPILKHAATFPDASPDDTLYSAVPKFDKTASPTSSLYSPLPDVLHYKDPFKTM